MKVIGDFLIKYKPKNREELKKLVEDKSVDLIEIDTSLITDMSYLFYLSNRKNNESFKGIEFWNTSNVNNMACMFRLCENFNQPLNRWNVSNVVNMEGMFEHCREFNQTLYNWDTENVTNMSHMFYGCLKLSEMSIFPKNSQVNTNSMYKDILWNYRCNGSFYL